MYPTTKELFEFFSRHRPESKLELIEGRLIVGNTIVSSRLLLQQILQGWKAEAAIALAPIELWIEALKIGFALSCSTEGNDISEALDILEGAVAEIAYQPEDLITGKGIANHPYHPHHGVLQSLSTGLFSISENFGGRSLSRDFVMRLGDNGFTPDVLFFKSSGLNQLCSWFLDGPAELVIEVLLPGHEYCDRVVKRDYYAAAGVPEYWIVNPDERRVEFWRLVNGKYRQQVPDADGRYRPTSISGLAFQSNSLWDEESWYSGRSQQDLFILEREAQPFHRIETIKREEWGSLPFAPQLQLKPTPIRFEEYISWCPRAKFEFFKGKPQISYKRGTKQVLGLLLMTFGLTSTVNLLPPQAWVQALKQRITLENQDEQRKAAWRQLAQQAATILREQFGVQRVGLIGDLARPQSLNYWSEIKLVVWETDGRSDWDIHRALSPISEEPEIQVLHAETDYLTVDEKEAIEGAIEI
ncbi:MAG: Uma2 family endonuclease [Leptolyngbyaceae cyanobacterium MO_188.B28]|nr:Uma2 family endonuclease [Leptolyngbyaceae cyanobacterium MO_188.B28]